MATMLTLADDVQAYVDELVRQGRFDSAEEVLNTGVRLLHDDDHWCRGVEQAAANGREQIARGEGLDAEQVFAALHERYRTWPR